MAKNYSQGYPNNSYPDQTLGRQNSQGYANQGNTYYQNYQGYGQAPGQKLPVLNPDLAVHGNQDTLSGSNRNMEIPK